MPLEKRLMLDASLPAIAGQVLWLDAADASTIRDADGDNAATGTGGSNNGFGGTVATWVDKSGSGFNVTNTNATQQPAYTTNALNGNAVITFDGSNDKLTNTGAVLTGNDYTAFIVFNRTTGTGRDGVFELGNGGSRNALFVNDSANKLGYYINGTFFNSTNVYTPGTYEIVSLVHDTTTFGMWRNGTNDLSATGGTTRATTTGIYVGDDSSSGDQLLGNIAEIIVYDRDLTADERHDVETYLAGKWGRVIADATPVVTTNTGATVLQGAALTIANTALASTDADNSESILRYTITDLADHGTLTNTNTSHTYLLGESFTQADIDAGYIRYTHDNTTNFSDSFSFTVTDGYATTAAGTFNLTITPSNVAPQFQGWTLVSSENFESGATGWSDNTTETGGAYLTRFLGRHSMEGGAQNTYKTYTMTGTQDYTVVEFDVYKIDSWDGEFFRVFINDSQVINLSFINGSFQTPVDGSAGAVSYTVQELTPFLTNFAFGGWNEQIFRFTLTVSNSAAANMKLGFSSTLDQAISDEAWGVDNINIYEVNEGTAPGPYTIAENSAAGTVVGRATATDADGGQTVTYSIVGGTGAGVFAINATTGVITVTGSLNYEAVSSYTLDIRATDNGTPVLFGAETITISIIDVPENTAPVLAALGPLSVAENAANGTVIGTASATDAQSNTITYSISGGNVDNIFAINSSTGAIRVNSNANLNYDFRNTYTLTIAATDNGFGNLVGTRNVTVNITNVNEAPTFDIPQSFLDQNPYLRYNATTGNFYQYVGTTANYTAASAAAAAATLNGVAGHLATITSAAENTYVRGLGAGALWLGATDAAVEGEWRWVSGGAESGQMFWLGAAAGSAQGGYYTNWIAGNPDNGSGTEDHLEMQTSGLWNDAVSSTAKAYVIEWEGSAVMAALGNGPFSLAENPALNQSVGFVHARDADAGDTLTYSITGGTGAANFALNASTGEITVINPSAINYESATSYTLDIRVQDAGGLFATQTVTVTITDVNETPVIPAAGPFSAAENAAVNTVVGTVSATDPDTGQTLTYSITGGNADNIFAINASTGAIRIANTTYLDYERATSYTLTVRATDNGTGALFASRTVTIDITDVNEGPSFDAVQRVLNSDPSLHYNASTGNFYRYVTATANHVTAQANAAGMLVNGVAGYITNINSAAENAFVTSLITTVSWIGGSDSAVEGEWRYTQGAEAGDLFWIGTSGGSAQNGNYNNWSGGEPNNSGNEDAIELRTDGRWNDINAATAHAYVVEWDGAAVLAGMENGPYAIDENSALNTVTGAALANDPDAGDTLTYSITGGTGAGLFAIDAATGQLTLTGAVNYEAVNLYTLDLRVQDAAGLFDTMTVTVGINDINDIPALLTLSANGIVENSAVGTAIGLLTTADEDVADTHTYSIISNPGGKFALVGNELRTAADIDYEANQTFTIVLRTDDGNGGTLDRSFLIQVGDVMDTYTPPPPTGSAGGIDPYVPPEEEGVAGPVDLLGSSLQGEQTQSRSFYREGWQVLRENITFKIRGMLGIGEKPAAPIYEETALVLAAAAMPAPAIDMPDSAARYTNLREALEFLQQLEKSEQEAQDGTQDSAERTRAQNLPGDTIDRQFVDVMTYHQERAARLREALLSA